jgi:hypothetical protein
LVIRQECYSLGFISHNPRFSIHILILSLPPSNHVGFLPPTLSPHFHVFQAFCWAHKNIQLIRSIYNSSEIRWLMGYELLATTSFPPILWYCKFGNFLKNSNISEISTLVMGNNWGTWKKQQSENFPIFLWRNDKICCEKKHWLPPL